MSAARKINRRGFIAALLAAPAVVYANKALAELDSAQDVILRSERGWFAELVDAQGRVVLVAPVKWIEYQARNNYYGRYNATHHVRGVEMYRAMERVRIRCNGAVVIETRLSPDVFGSSLVVTEGETITLDGDVYGLPMNPNLMVGP